MSNGHYARGPFCAQLTLVISQGFKAKNTLRLFIKILVAELIIDVLQNEQAGGNAKGKAGYINEGKNLVFENGPEGHFEVVA